MQNDYEALIKITLVAVLVLAGLLYMLLPKLRISNRLHFSESLYVSTATVGILSGIVGLVLTFALPVKVVELHIWEMVLMPFALMYFYWALVLKIKRHQTFLDEKQELDMTRAAGLTLAISIPAMAALAVISGGNGLAEQIWLPYYLFVTVLVYSVGSLIYYKSA